MKNVRYIVQFMGVRNWGETPHWITCATRPDKASAEEEKSWLEKHGYREVRVIPL